MQTPKICQYCGREFSEKGIATHIWRKHGEGINHVGGNIEGRIPWNKGLNSETDERVKKGSAKLREAYSSGKIKVWCSGKELSEETRRKLSKNAGGYRRGSGGGKSGTYKGFHFDSTWELAWSIYNWDHDIKFERCKLIFEYEYDGNKFKYNPDFIMNDNLLIEIKGFMRRRDYSKINSIPSEYIIRIIGKNEIEPFIRYCKEKFSVSDLSLVYDESTPKITALEIRRNKDIEVIRNSDIDFSKDGWITKVSKITGRGRNGIIRFMKKYLFEIYNEAYKR